MTVALLSLDDFEPLVGQRFEVEGGGTALELLSATALRHASVGGRHGFTLLFRGPPEPAFGQGMRTLSHAALGSHDIFIVPVGFGPQGFDYEAVFN